MTTTAPAVVTAGKNLDLHTAGQMREGFRDAINNGAVLVIADLTGCEFMDSTGLGVLVGGMRRARAHDARFGVACPSQSLRRKISITRLSKVLDVRDTVEAFTVGGDDA